MKIIKQIPAYLLAIIFLVFGLNFWLKFIPMPPISGNPQTFLNLLYSTGFLQIVKIMEVLFAILLIIPKTRNLGYILIAPIVVVIFMYEIFIANAVSIGLVILLLNAAGIFLNREKYISIVK